MALRRVDRKALILGAVFSILAIVGFVAFSGLYESAFPLLIGWLVAYVLIAKWLVGEKDDDQE